MAKKSKETRAPKKGKTSTESTPQGYTEPTPSSVRADMAEDSRKFRAWARS